jgi:hypothetical protein
MTETAYTLGQIKKKAEHFGEFMVVLESDREYDFHNFTVTIGPEEGDRLPPLADNEFRIEGLHEDEDGDTEHLVVDIPVGRVEHVYAHRDL